MVMMIHKYPLQYAADQDVTMPAHAEILDVQLQGNELQLWARVSTMNTPVKRRILMRGTGHEVPAPGEAKYISTVQEGRFVWHFFDEGQVR
jgi:hypothetical protein